MTILQKKKKHRLLSIVIKNCLLFTCHRNNLCPQNCAVPLQQIRPRSQLLNHIKCIAETILCRAGENLPYWRISQPVWPLHWSHKSILIELFSKKPKKQQSQFEKMQPNFTLLTFRRNFKYETNQTRKKSRQTHCHCLARSDAESVMGFNEFHGLLPLWTERSKLWPASSTGTSVQVWF